ncbi:DUF2934 domain-containing protein [Rhodospirillaceae bacterium SYSU D60014]|uniref:DUF2934 domain-containing protein n=1 Tax=Virgifigura deserti TaxID=2268457 RepID=UPI000E65F06D
MVGTNLEAKIKERAYQLWEGEGRPHGKHLEHWRRAEQEVKSQADQSILQRSMERSNPAPGMSPSSPAGATSTPAGSTPAEAAAAAGESKAAVEGKRARTKTTAKTKTKTEPKSKTAAKKPRSSTTKPTV